MLAAEDPSIVRFVNADGTFEPTPAAHEYQSLVDDLDEETLASWYVEMVRVRALDREATNLQRQGQLALWPPSLGQEGAQVGSVFAARPQDVLFPSYREHVVATARGVDPVDIIRLMKGHTHGGWNPEDERNGNVRLYTLVLGSQVLHAAGYAMGVRFDGHCGTGEVNRDRAVMAYYGDGASSQGDVHEAMVFANSYRVPLVFFVQNNHWAISVPVSTQSRVPLSERAAGYGMPSVQLDGNDVLASYAVTRTLLDRARAGEGPAAIEAVTYRMGAHTTSDDPTKYRSESEEQSWSKRDPISRFRAYLIARGAAESLFATAEEAAADSAADVRRRTLALEPPEPDSMFAHVYREEHPLMEQQRAFLADYEASFEAGA